MSTIFARNSFSVVSSKIWNSIPPVLRMCTGLVSFHHHLETFKSHYFQRAFQPIVHLRIIFTYLLTPGIDIVQ